MGLNGAREEVLRNSQRANDLAGESQSYQESDWTRGVWENIRRSFKHVDPIHAVILTGFEMHHGTFHWAFNTIISHIWHNMIGIQGA